MKNYVSTATLALLTAHQIAFAAESPNPATNAPARLPQVTVIGTLASDLPRAAAATVVSGDTFTPGGITDSRELTAISPNFAALDGNNPRTPRFSVRGFRENAFLAGEPAVALYVDDVPYTDLASRGLPLFDVERAEFLRGPQGTMFGASAPGGVINIRTRRAENDWHGHAGFSYGNYDSQDYQASVGGALVKDKLFLDVAGLFAQRDGFVENSQTVIDPGGHPIVIKSRIDDRESLAGRVRLTWTPDEAWEISFALDAARFRDDFVPTFYPGHDADFFHVMRDLAGHVDTDSFGQSLRAGFHNESVKVTSVTTHRQWNQDLLQDFDFMPFPIRDGFSRPSLNQWTEELRVQSPDDSAKWRWLGGFYFSSATTKSDSGSDEFTPITLDPSGPLVTQPTTFRTLATTDARTYAIFGQVTHDITEQFEAILGARATFDEREMSRSKTVSSPSATFGGFPIGPFANTFGVYDVEGNSSDVQPRVGLIWHFTKDAEAYFNFTSGYQSGGFNSATDSAANSTYNPARSWHYEVGAKTSWLENKLTADASLFLTDARNYQTYRLNASDPTQAFLQNAESATLMGAELELAARPADGWQFDAALGFTHARYDRYFDAVNGATLDGKTISFVPEFTLNVGAQYRFDFGLLARIEAQGVGKYFLTEDNSARQSGFALLNARLGYEAKHWGVSVFGRNLTDEHYASGALDLRNAFQPDQLILQPGNPRTFGVQLTAKF